MGRPNLYQTGLPLGTFKRGDSHPTVPDRFYFGHSKKSGYEFWYSQEQYISFAKNAVEKTKLWVQRNPDYRVKWWAENAGKAAYYASQRRKLIRDQKHISKPYRKQILEYYVLAAYLTKITGVEYAVDHIIPLKCCNELGTRIATGLHVPWNLQIITKEANSQKSNKIRPEIKGLRIYESPFSVLV
jgi:hypothetical protein